MRKELRQQQRIIGNFKADSGGDGGGDTAGRILAVGSLAAVI